MQIKASVSRGFRPTTLVFRRQPNSLWDEWDFKLLEAFQIVDDETCTMCGNPVWQCQSKTRDIGFKVVERVCFATREIEEYRASASNNTVDKETRERWGRYEVAKPFTTPSGDIEQIAEEPIPSRLECWERM